MAMALEGIKVIDVAQVAAVPMCARLLGDFGADVIHVENTNTGDSWRWIQAGAPGGPGGIPSDLPYNWEAFNRNKKSLGLNLSKPAGQEIMHKLVEEADVFLTNLRIFEREKYNVDYETLNAINPKLIYGSVTGHGLKGPDKDIPAYDTSVYWGRAAVNHLLTIPGSAGANPRAAFGDNAAGMGLAFGIMMAMYVRNKTGKGQQVDTSLFMTGLYQLTFDYASALATGQDEMTYRLENFVGTDEDRRLRDSILMESGAAMMKLGDFYRQRMPNPLANNYGTKDGRTIRFIALQADRYWGKFCEIIGRPELENDPKFNTMEAREQNNKEVFTILRDAFLTKTLEEWKPLIRDIPSAPMQTLVEVIDDPQTKANNFYLDYDHPTHGPMKIVGHPVNLSDAPPTVRSPAPEFSQHTEEILLDAGFTWEQIAQFKDDEIIP